MLALSNSILHHIWNRLWVTWGQCVGFRITRNYPISMTILYSCSYTSR